MKPYPITYCLNAHDSSSWSAVQNTLETQVLAVKQRVAPDRPFLLSLHLSERALCELDNVWLTHWLRTHDCQWVALNAFPIGNFQEENIKASVYRPNWRNERRLDYTCRACFTLARFLPSDALGTVTTVPGGWLEDWTSRASDKRALSNLQQAATFCADIERVEDRHIHIAVEPEPGCAWKLFDPRVENCGPEICWCLDTCHAAIEFQSIEQLNWRRIGRVQLSAAIECDNDPAARAALASFVEPRYLHQTRAALDGEIIGAWNDLGPALLDLPKLPQKAVIRTHYHVPLTWPGAGPLRSTRDLITPTFLQNAQNVFCEVETYTYSVLPTNMRPTVLEEGIAAELKWAMEKLNTQHSTSNIQVRAKIY